MKASRSCFVYDDELEEYRAVVSQLIWLANQTSYDIAFEACELRARVHSSTMLLLKMR